VPIGITALRGYGNERSDFLITTLPVLGLDPLTPTPLVFPQFADGGGWKTQVILVNPTGSTLTGSLEFFSQGSGTTAGTRMTVTVNGTTGQTFNYNLGARSVTKFETSGAGATLKSGWARVTPSSGQNSPAGFLIFSFKT